MHNVFTEAVFFFFNSDDKLNLTSNRLQELEEQDQPKQDLEEEEQLKCEQEEEEERNNEEEEGDNRMNESLQQVLAARAILGTLAASPPVPASTLMPPPFAPPLVPNSES